MCLSHDVLEYTYSSNTFNVRIIPPQKCDQCVCPTMYTSIRIVQTHLMFVKFLHRSVINVFVPRCIFLRDATIMTGRRFVVTGRNQMEIEFAG